jgi:hypothetical protein
MLKRARNMEKKYVTLIQQQMEEGGNPRLVQNLEFAQLGPALVSFKSAMGGPRSISLF